MCMSSKLREIGVGFGRGMMEGVCTTNTLAGVQIVLLSSFFLEEAEAERSLLAVERELTDRLDRGFLKSGFSCIITSHSTSFPLVSPPSYHSTATTFLSRSMLVMAAK